MGLLTGSISKLGELARTITGVLSPSGLITRIFETSRTALGAISTSGTLLVNGFKYIASSISDLSFSGAVSYVRSGTQRLFTAATSGALSFIGNLYKGWLYGTVTRIVERFKGPSGVLSMVGDVLTDRGQFYVKTISGILSSSGSYLYGLTVPYISTGLLLGGGILTKMQSFGRTQAGVITQTGRAIRTNANVTKLYDGTVSFAGVVSRGTYNAYSGAVTFAGAVALSLLVRVYSATGTLSTAGTFLRELIAARAKDGVLILTGAVSGIKGAINSFYWVGESGVLALTGVLTQLKDTTRSISGVLGVIGRITIIDIVMKRISAASITPIGNLYRNIVTNRTRIVSSLSLVGLLSYLKLAPNFISGAVSFAGTVVNDTTGGVWNYSCKGVLAITGGLSKLSELIRLYAGGITPSGIASRIIDCFRAGSGVLSFAGSVLSIITGRDWMLGTLNFVGTLTKDIKTGRATESSNLSFVGVLTRELMLMRNIVGGQVLVNGRIEKYKDILYYGPPNP